jgi:hypothetical protein
MSHDHPQNEAELLEFLHAIDVPAPESVRLSTDALLAEHTGRARARPIGFRLPRLGVGAAGALAVGLAAALALVLSLGGSSSPSMSLRAAAMTLAPATGGPPPESSRSHTELAAAVDGIAFPYWGQRFGWHSSGSRRDRIDGRTVTTVFYSNPHGQRVGYAIVGGSPAPSTGSGTVVWRHGTPYRVEADGEGQAVVWVRRGHLCIVAGRNVSAATLLRLASWDEHGTAA